MLSEVERKLEREPECVLKAYHASSAECKVIGFSKTKTY
jgi:hypothetical protein